MSLPHSNPDLEESINVAQIHERIAREAAAAAREHVIAEDGREPVAVWIIVICGIAALIAGGVIHSAGHLFSYQDTFRDHYVRESADGAAGAGPEPRPALAAYMARGQKIYSAKCNGCHGPDAKGDGSNYPSLVGSEWITGDSQRLGMIILSGLQGPTSTGKTFGVMTSQRQGLSAEDLAGVMTYVRNSYGNSVGDVITKEMAEAAFEIADQRETPSAPVTSEELAAAHNVALPGDALDPDTLINPLTFAPAEP